MITDLRYFLELPSGKIINATRETAIIITTRGQIMNYPHQIVPFCGPNGKVVRASNAFAALMLISCGTVVVWCLVQDGRIPFQCWLLTGIFVLFCFCYSHCCRFVFTNLFWFWFKMLSRASKDYKELEKKIVMARCGR